MAEVLRSIDGRDLRDRVHFLHEIVLPCQPVVLRGLVNEWPLVTAGRISPRSVYDHLSPWDIGGQIDAFFGAAAIAGKYYYTDDLKGFNFERRRMKFRDALEAIVTFVDAPDSPTMYMGSVPTEDHLPGFAAANGMPLLEQAVSPRVWIGHASNVSTHYDAMDNLACVAVGTRRFTLFPPQSIAGLYVGPIDHTMAGQPVSLAASSAPDKARFPLFEDIKDRALVAELQAGDALYLPKLWWHKVESTAKFNVLVNYWWDAFSGGPDAPYTSLLLSLITIAERPLAERQAWKAFFDHYVFRTSGHPLAHLPSEQHGLLGPLKPSNYGKLRARVMHLLRGGK